MRPPSWQLDPRSRTTRPPPRGRQGAASGDQGTPLFPPPSAARGRAEAGRTYSGPASPRGGRCTQGGGAPKPRQAQPRVKRPR